MIFSDEDAGAAAEGEPPHHEPLDNNPDFRQFPEAGKDLQ
jgi:hypothetical protein